MLTVAVTNTNSKLGHQIPSINLPTGITCRKNAPCLKGCYARRGRFMYKNVRNCYENNYRAYLSDSDYFFSEVIRQTRLSLYVRWHSAGDIVDDKYFEGMIKVAKINKNVKYLCFTKKYEIVNNYLASGKRIPTNLHIIFSNWDKFICENPYNLPTSWVFGKGFDNDAIPQIAIPCKSDCSECLACWQLKKGQSIFLTKH